MKAGKKPVLGTIRYSERDRNGSKQIEYLWLFRCIFLTFVETRMILVMLTL